MSSMSEWSIAGAEGKAIIGNAHLPGQEPERARGVVLIAHGFKGYKDYGMFPRIADTLADAGFIAHRFNFSHSGMTNAVATFERPDLFEADTWNKQVFDCRAVVSAVRSGRLAGGALPYVIFGHSRGGASALLTAGRCAGEQTFPAPAGIITASTPHTCNMLDKEDANTLLAEGFLVSPSARTGQPLRIGKAFLAEQLEAPEAHDLLALVARITCPVLLVHGKADPTVPAVCGQMLAAAIGAHAEVKLIAGGDHVYNTPNPLPPDADASPQLQEVLDAVTTFATASCGRQASPSS
ncbi:MAG: alpha/beta hydrolase [Planctomycetota bacterium]|jgi:dienelactone hydrolase